MKGFTQDEILLMSLATRYHRKATPKETHEPYGKLSSAMRERVRVLSALLRVADGLDRGYVQRVRSVRCRLSDKSVELALSANGDTELGVHRIPISLTDVSSQKTIDPSTVRDWTIKKVNEKIDYATIDVTSKQHVVVGYRAFNKNTMPNLARYAILYNGESQFRPSQNAVNLAGSSGTGFFQLDYFGSQRDTLDPTGVWALLADENGVVMMFVRP